MGLIKYLHPSLAAAVLGALAASCSNSGGSAGSGTMFVETCSLGCSNGQTGLQVSCANSSISQNQELRVLFSQAVDINSVNASTFQIINPANSDVPLGNFFLDPANPSAVIFRPALSLNATTGQPEFGMDPLTTYLVTIPGVQQGDSPPYIMSASGRANQSRLQCTVTTTSETVDLVPGPPQATLFVDLDNGTTGVPLEGAVDVALDSSITIVFNDVMNSATLVNPITGTSDFIRILIDPDGLTFDPTDRFALPGTFTIDTDEVQLRTTVVFTPSSGFPSGGSGVIPRKVVVVLPDSIQDLSGNALFNDGEFVFTPAIVTFPPIALPDADGENFTDTLNEDGSRSSAEWGGGRVELRLTSGGSGRLGDLRVLNNQTVVLNTDSQLFPIPDQPSTGFAGQEHDIMSNFVPGVDYDPADAMTWPTITVTDGIFEFSTLRINSGGRVIFTGSNPARVMVRGEAFVGGVLDVSGVSPGAHDSSSQLGQAGGLGGPNGGNGGSGGVRFDHETSLLAGEGGNASQFSDVVCAGGAGHPTCVSCAATSFCVPSDFQDLGIGAFADMLLDGSAGEGVAKAAAGTSGGAPGGAHWPNLFPILQNIGIAANRRDLELNRLKDGLMRFDEAGNPTNELLPGRHCTSLQVSGTGGGGVYGRSSQPSQPQAFTSVLGIEPNGTAPHPITTGDFGTSNVAPATAPGDQAAIGLDFITRRLNPFFGDLRGGAGGGGGGTNLFGTLTDSPNTGMTFPPCTTGNLDNYVDNSGAAGGGGGGALQLHSGTRITVSGTIDASGGNGGDSLAADSVTQSSAAPGGGGSGGAILLQTPSLMVADVAGALNVSGGLGGVGLAGSIGGDGGGGLVSIETRPILDMTQVLDLAEDILPFDPAIPDSNDILSIQQLGPPRLRPESISASVSCWMRPQGNFVTLGFAEDDTSDPDPANHTFGWNMMLRIDTAPGPANTTIQLEPYRGPNSILADSFENAFGNMLNHGMPTASGSPVAVRFQGARLQDPTASLCDLDLNGADRDIVEGSLTPWVNHPAELNDFVPVPEMIRFCVIFDRDVDPATLDMVKGATDLIILAQPD